MRRIWYHFCLVLINHLFWDHSYQQSHKSDKYILSPNTIQLPLSQNFMTNLKLLLSSHSSLIFLSSIDFCKKFIFTLVLSFLFPSQTCYLSLPKFFKVNHFSCLPDWFFYCSSDCLHCNPLLPGISEVLNLLIFTIQWFSNLYRVQHYFKKRDNTTTALLPSKNKYHWKLLLVGNWQPWDKKIWNPAQRERESCNWETWTEIHL